MRKISFVLYLPIGIFLVFSVGFARAQTLITPDLENQITKASPAQFLPIDVIMQKQADPLYLESLVADKSKAERRAIVVAELKRFSSADQKSLLLYLRDLEEQGKIAEIQSFWIVNAIYLKATKAAIYAIAKIPGIYYIDYDLKKVSLCSSSEATGFLTTTATDTAWGVRKIEAHQVWSLGYTGQNVIVGHIDTGVNYNHSDLSDHMWTDPNYPNHGWDFEGNDNDPMDNNGHGTHTAGTVAGDGTAGVQTGVAPDAQIMALKVTVTADMQTEENQMWAAMQFAVDHGADLITMSMGFRHVQGPRRSTWRTNCNNILAAGLVMTVAAGNYGYDPDLPPDGIATPADVPPPWRNPDQASGGLSAVIAVGATDGSDNMWYNIGYPPGNTSGCGPVSWSNISPFYDYPYPPGLIKPDVTAPGVNIKSLRHDSDTGYIAYSGTSMAAPHVAGTVALLLSAYSELWPAQIDKLLELTALDLGTSGKDNFYGAGRINAYEAVHTLIEPPAAPVGLYGWSEWLPNKGWIIKLRWRKNTEPDMACYRVWRAMQSGGPYTNVGVVLHPDTTYTNYFVQEGQTYYYVVTAHDWPDNQSDYSNEVAVYVGEEDIPKRRGIPLALDAVPKDFDLTQNYPNPFNPVTEIKYQLPRASWVTIKVYDLLGREIMTLVNNKEEAGYHIVQWKGKNSLGIPVPSGVYVYKIVAGDYSNTKKMVLIR